jgi:hypothetical protein
VQPKILIHEINGLYDFDLLHFIVLFFSLYLLESTPDASYFLRKCLHLFVGKRALRHKTKMIR